MGSDAEGPQFDDEHDLAEPIADPEPLGTFDSKAENVVLLGPPGDGKTYLAIGLGVKAAQAGHSVLFDTASNLIARLGSAHHAGALETELKKIRRYRLIIIEEVGYIRLVHWSQARRVCSPTVPRTLAG